MENGLILKIIIGLSCWQIGHAAVAMVRLALVEWKSMLLSQDITSFLATMANFVHELIGWYKDGWRNKLIGTNRIGHSIYLVIEMFLCWGHTSVNIHKENKYLHFFCLFREIYPHIYSSNFLVTNFPIYSFHLSNHPVKRLEIAHEFVYVHTFSHFSFQEKWTIRCIAWHSVLWEALWTPLPFKDIPAKGYSTTGVDFQVLPV